MHKIISCSDRAKSILAEARSAEVHSVYARTVNIMTEHGLLSIHSRGTPLSPIALETDMTAQELSDLHMERGMRAKPLADGLRLQEHFFSMSGAELWSSKISGVGVDAEFLAECISRMKASGGFSDIALKSSPPGTDEACIEAAAILKRAEALILCGAFEKAARELTGLVGLGAGLTPSGDDFLCGMLAAADYSASAQARQLRRALCAELEECLSGTNDISAAFLACAIDGCFSQAVTELGLHSAESSSRSFSMIGHSSGADTLNGMLYFMNCMDSIREG